MNQSDWRTQLEMLGRVLGGDLEIYDNEYEDRLGRRILEALDRIYRSGSIEYPIPNGKPVTIVENHWIAAKLTGHLKLYLPWLMNQAGYPYEHIVNTYALRLPMLGVSKELAHVMYHTFQNPLSMEPLLDALMVYGMMAEEGKAWGPPLGEIKKPKDREALARWREKYHTKASLDRRNRKLNTLASMRIAYPVLPTTPLLEAIDSDKVRVLYAPMRGSTEHQWMPILPRDFSENVSVNQWSFLLINET